MALPKCFASRDQYEAWRNAARLTKVGRDGICSDCTAEYQARMIAQRRCESPHTTFRRDDDEMEAGVRPLVLFPRRNRSDGASQEGGR